MSDFSADDADRLSTPFGIRFDEIRAMATILNQVTGSVELLTALPTAGFDPH